MSRTRFFELEDNGRRWAWEGWALGLFLSGLCVLVVAIMVTGERLGDKALERRQAAHERMLDECRDLSTYSICKERFWDRERSSTHVRD